MTHVQDLREKRSAFLATANSIIDRVEQEKRSFSADERKDLDGLKTKIADMDSTIERIDQIRDFRAADEEPMVRSQAAGRINREPGEPLVLTGEMRAVDALRGTYPVEHDGLSLGKFVRGYVTGNWDGAEGEQRAMAEGTVGAGGAMVPTPLSARVIDAIRKRAMVLRAGALTVPMDSSTLKLARLKTDPTAAWTAENASITASDGEFEPVTFTAQKLAAMVKCSVELIEDAPNASTVIENALAEVLALEVDRVALFGSGAAPEPKGLSIYANTVVPEVLMGENGATLIDYVNLSDAYFTVVGNNITPTAAIYAPRTAKQMDQFYIAATGEPLTPPDSWKSLQKFVTNQVPVNLTQGTAAGVCSNVFIGDFSGLAFGTRTNLVLEASRQAGTAFVDGQVWIRAYLRGDVQLLRPKAFCTVRGLKP